MAKGDRHSLRQRTYTNRSSNVSDVADNNDNNDNNGTLLPLTMPQHESASAAPRGFMRSNRRRKLRSRRRWERQFKHRVILVNIMVVCILFGGGIGLLAWYRGGNNSNKQNVNGPTREHNTLIDKIQSLRINPQTAPRIQHQQNYDFVCKSHPDHRGILNDDYCDCPDGSDEPHTSACSHLLVGQRVFSCNNNNSNNNNGGGGDGGLMVFASRVRDGIVDCPNKADEL